MFPETTTKDQYTVVQPHLYIAFELSQTQWMLGFTIGFHFKSDCHLGSDKVKNLL